MIPRCRLGDRRPPASGGWVRGLPGVPAAGAYFKSLTRGFVFSYHHLRKWIRTYEAVLSSSEEVREFKLREAQNQVSY